MKITQHTTDKQPPETKGKMVQYKTGMVHDENGKVIGHGHWHHKAPANALNWKTGGIRAPKIGPIEAYIIEGFKC